MPSIHRPAFNTLQQHYSPAKATPKPPLPSSRPLPSSEETQALSSTNFERSKAQYELLYLSLLHQEATANRETYEGSGRSVLQAEFEALEHEKEQSRRLEHAYDKQLNVKALKTWAKVLHHDDKEANAVAADCARRLGSFAHEIDSLCGPTGRYSDLVREFNVRMESADRALQSRKTGDEQSFVDGLPHRWHESHTWVQQRLRLLERELDTFRLMPDTMETTVSESVLVRALRILNKVISGAKAEMDLLLELEKQVLVRDVQQIDEAINNMDLAHLPIATETRAWRA
ncbi:hypothetical protein AAFC00_001837 [Neodothiora populina]